jgi:ribonuclease T2
MPAPQLVYHEWDEHGTCSGLSAAAYFKTFLMIAAVVIVAAISLGFGHP